MDDYTRRRLAAMRREQLGLISAADREIVGIYQRAQEEMARQARNARSGSLTERWLKDYSRSLEETVGQMRQDIYGTVRDAAARAAQLPANFTLGWLDIATERAGVDASFRGVLSRAPTDAIRAIIDGRMYRDGITLSRRIWDKTGWLQHGVENVITQGLAQQQDLKSIARALEQYMQSGEKAPIDIRRLYPSMGEPVKGGQPIPSTYQIEYNSLRLARTAVNHAYWGANKAGAKLNPLCTGMRWILSEEHFARQVAKWGPDVCDDYAAHDEGLGKGVYPVDKLPLPHPQCLCRQEQVVPTLDEAVDRLNRWVAGGSDAALQQGFELAQKRAALDKPSRSATMKPQTPKADQAAPKPPSSAPLRKGITSLGKRAEEHNAKIEDMRGLLGGMDPVERKRSEGTIRHWEREIRNFERQIQRMREELERRGEQW